MQSTHTKALEVEANIFPLTQRRTILTDRYISKKLSHHGDSIIRIIEKYRESVMLNGANTSGLILDSYNKLMKKNIEQYDRHPYFLNLYESIHHSTNVYHLNELNINEGTNLPKQLEILLDTEWKEHCQVYTDGSKEKLNASCAVWIPDYNIEAKFYLNPGASVMSSEAKAIKEALNIIDALKVEKTIIMSDSKSCLLSIAKYTSVNTHPEIMHIRNMIHKITKEGKEIVLLWIPGHAGIEGNEYVDQLAKPEPGKRNPLNKIYHKDLKEYIQNNATISWQHAWDNSEHGRRLHELNPKVNQTPWFQNIGMDRLSIVSLCRLRFGHTKTCDHLK